MVIINLIFNITSSFEIQNYYPNKPIFEGVFPQDNLPKIKDGVYIINLDEYSDIRTHWVALRVNNNGVTYFESFGVENILKEIKTFINNINIKTSIFRIQTYDSVMCEYFCIRFIDFIFIGKILSEFTNPFFFFNIILKYFMNNAYV